jgi:hypothetical protein
MKRGEKKFKKKTKGEKKESLLFVVAIEIVDEAIVSRKECHWNLSTCYIMHPLASSLMILEETIVAFESRALSVVSAKEGNG